MRVNLTREQIRLMITLEWSDLNKDTYERDWEFNDLYWCEEFWKD